ncbi:MAG: hypothetical protein QOG28_6277 [Trebonia sp.]|nr:hypothetical protein [Trebonia sp.]
MTESPPLRRNDYALSADQRALAEAFEEFFRKECPSSRVRDAEATGFDAGLWTDLCRLGAVSMAVGDPAAGGRASLVDLTLVAEPYGRYLAPLPLIESIVAAHMLERLGTAPATEWLHRLAEASCVVAVALSPVQAGRRQLVPAGAIADAVLCHDGAELVLFEPARPLAHVRNQACAPLARLDATGPAGARTVLAHGPAAVALMARARQEWKLLTAAALAGLAAGAVELGIDFAKSRHAFGAPIGTFQAIAHSLVDAAAGAAGSRHLTWKAAWFSEHEPASAEALVPMAYLHSIRSAVRATAVGVHVQGGFGFTRDSDEQLYFRRAKGWPLVYGDPNHELSVIADAIRNGWAPQMTA